MWRAVPRLVLILAVALAGCASPEAMRAADAERCQGYGFKPETDAYSECLQHESLARRYGWPPAGWYPAYPAAGPWRY